MTSSHAKSSSRCANANGARGLILAGLALAAATASGCVPFPVTPGPFPDSRTNVPADVPTTIVAGQTTRREVLFEFGEPDGAGPAESWYSYGSATSHGGAGSLFVAPNNLAALTRESVEFRRLIVRFDAAGTVSEAKLETKRCAFWYGPGLAGSNGPQASVPCLDIRARDVGDQTGLAGGNERPTLSEPAASVMASTAQGVLGRYEYVIRRAGDCPVHGRPRLDYGTVYPGELQILPDAMLLTIPAHTQMQRSAFVDHPAVSTRVPLAQIDSVEALKGRGLSTLWAWVNVHMKDGSCSSFQFTGYTKAEEATQLIRQHIEER